MTSRQKLLAGLDTPARSLPLPRSTGKPDQHSSVLPCGFARATPRMTLPGQRPARCRPPLDPASYASRKTTPPMTPSPPCRRAATYHHPIPQDFPFCDHDLRPASTAMSTIIGCPMADASRSTRSPSDSNQTRRTRWRIRPRHGSSPCSTAGISTSRDACSTRRTSSRRSATSTAIPCASRRPLTRAPGRPAAQDPSGCLRPCHSR